MFIDVAIIGAGPYGLSLAAHLRRQDINFRVFGMPMAAWKDNMPRGMLLKSYPWASNLADADDHFTTGRFCAENGVPYHDSLLPLSRETFISYGEAFQAQHVPTVERKLLATVEPTTGGFSARFDDGEIVQARRIVVAVGVSAFGYLPPIASGLPSEVVSHSSVYGRFDALEGKRVAVVGSGSSATDLAALLHESGIAVELVARSTEVNFASPPRSRGLLARAIGPTSGIGNGWTMSICANSPGTVHFLPDHLRLRLANAAALGPLGGAFMKERVVGQVPLWLGRSVRRIKLHNGSPHLHLVAADGKKDIVSFDHVIFATGYKIDTERMPFLAPAAIAGMRLIGTAPRLSIHYESSVPGLHFIGPAAASSFGPVCRFVFGARHAARHLARHLSAALGKRASPNPFGNDQTDTPGSVVLQ